MRLTRSLLPLSLAAIAAACGSIPTETAPPPEGREFAPAGVLRGNVVYSGPAPCSSNGHVVGAAILFVFDRHDLPPPNGLATTPVNFGVVTGDALFPDVPRNPGPSTYCPPPGDAGATLTISAPFAISPLAAGSYVIEAFYDSRGDFLPTFKFRDLPEQGDIGGGDIDTADALAAINAGNPNYQPKLVPVDVGTPLPLPAGAPPGEIPEYVLPDDGGTGVVVDNLTVTLGAPLPAARPYFFAGGLATSFDPGTDTLTSTEVQSSAVAGPNTTGIGGAQESNPDDYPILTIPQDIQVLAAPTQNIVQANVDNFESKFPHLLLHWGVPPGESATSAAPPFHFQVPPAGPPGFSVWQSALFDAARQSWVPQDIPEGGGIPALWPLVVLAKLDTSVDPTSLTSTTTQGDPKSPVVILQGITLLGGDGLDATRPDTLFNTGTAEAFGLLFDGASGRPTIFPQDHLTVLVRPAVICFDSLFDPNDPDKRGTLVTPYLSAPSADLTGSTMQPILPAAAFATPQLASLVAGAPLQACLPTGRYAINVVYPNGQTWTVPNESGVCSSAEGATDYANLTCTLQPRPVLRSQGARAVVEITPASDPTRCPGSLQGPPVCLPAR
jgi:hypothetical protein